MKLKRAVFTALKIKSEDDISLTCSFTGYRPAKLPFLWKKESEEYERLYNALKNEIVYMYSKGVRYFQSGMALGIDLMCGEIVLELKKAYSDIHLFCIIPCSNQTNGWKDEDKKLYRRILDGSSGVTYVSDKPYKEGCMMARNRFLVDTAQYILAVYNGLKGGTMSTVKYAQKNNRTVILIDPTDFTRVELVHGNPQGVLYV